ncbi:hypothetical protein E2C01_068928 [Portunus trituberculatus]|uniref:Uncharacterized protein n=1 Tax=Portunus trituberculatus TaxID=210409 RepID=A0A5B7HXJ3_PORTR|nr:hypothetical protein [Portunus trituberculatus]
MKLLAVLPKLYSNDMNAVVVLTVRRRGTHSRHSQVAVKTNKAAVCVHCTSQSRGREGEKARHAHILAPLVLLPPPERSPTPRQDIFLSRKSSEDLVNYQAPSGKNAQYIGSAEVFSISDHD